MSESSLVVSLNSFVKVDLLSSSKSSNKILAEYLSLAPGVGTGLLSGAYISFVIFDTGIYFVFLQNA